MILWDTNLWVYAFRSDSPFHNVAHEVLSESLHGAKPVLFLPSVATSFIRIVTNERIFNEPSTPEEAWKFVDTIESSPNIQFSDFDQMAFGIFKHLSLVHRAAGNTVPDIMLASIAIRNDSILVTHDRGFLKYPELQIQLI